MVISDYATCTDEALMVPIRINIDRVQPQFVTENTLHAVGHVWGHAVENLLAPLQGAAGNSDGDDNEDAAGQDNAASAEGGGVMARGATAAAAAAGNKGFDIVIMADLLFNRSQHAQLLETCDRCLREGSDEGTVWVSFSHHDPEKAELDMKFFALAREKGFVAARIKTVSASCHRRAPRRLPCCRYGR